jgi:hypothetical protein
MPAEPTELPQNLLTGLLQLAQVLEQFHLRYALIGGVAAGYRSRPRFTRDLDFLLEVPQPVLECLDAADPNLSVPVRNTTLTALQALALLNNPFMVRQAEYFAERLRQFSDDTRRQVEEAYRLAFSRTPGPKERDAVAGYARRHGLASACRVLFNANEFVFLD